MVRVRFHDEYGPTDRDVRIPVHVMRAYRSAAFLLLLLVAGCAGIGNAPPGTPQPTQTGKPQPAPHPLDPEQAERIRRIMAPLVAAMDHPRPLSQVRVGIMDDPHVNAASAGGGEFYVTTGLLQKANDEHLRGVLAHELAHDDLGHVAKAQALGAGLGIGIIILDQIFPGSGRITPIAGALVVSSYSRSEEYAADRHGVDILTRAGYSKTVMINTLIWLVQTEGASSGGILATHPGTQERIDALKKV
jgi:predicted Zn-dependent protease